jgi:hypothetical protein
MRGLVLTSFLCLSACSSTSSDTAQDASNGTSSGGCVTLDGTWTVTMHCDTSLVGLHVVVSQSGCLLTFAAPFDGFTGNVTTANVVTLSGPQSCTGPVGPSAQSLSLSCTPGTCLVTLTR